MKKWLIIAATCLLISCAQKSPMNIADRYIIETTVKIQEGKTNEVLALFKSTNPQLVKGESDWITASFSVVEGMDMVVVRAEWKSKASYLKFSTSEKFKSAMGQFGKHFAGKPEVTITKVLFQM
jgi:heme-degrading monooxygenase HmoA